MVMPTMTKELNARERMEGRLEILDRESVLTEKARNWCLKTGDAEKAAKYDEELQEMAFEREDLLIKLKYGSDA